MPPVLVAVVATVLLATALGGLTVLRLPPLSVGRVLDGVVAVEVRLFAGRIEIGEDDRGDVRVDATVRRRFGRARPRVTLVAGTLRIDGQASEARIRLRLPRATPVRAELRSGELTLWGSAGDLTLLTDTATIAGRELAGAAVTARSRTGDVSLHFVHPPRRLSVAGDDGALTLVLPDDRYAIEVETANPAAAARVDVRADPTAAATVLVRTRTGRVSIRTAAAAGPTPI